jgi:hypothetical protein
MIWLSGVGAVMLVMAGGVRPAPVSGPAPGTIDVRAFGARGDGETFDTRAIRAAIAAAAERGGGIVHVPPGTYVTGTIALASNVTLHLDAGATLLGSPHAEDYQVRTDDGARTVWHALVHADAVKHVAITGRGTIRGQGSDGDFKVTPPKFREPRRPVLLGFYRSRSVRVEGITLRDAPAWVQHYLDCENVTIDGITVYSHANYNNDMFDIDGCRDVRITNCTGDTGDDALTLKSTGVAICENITVANCVFSSHANAIKMGTESRGGFRNITITNCVIRPARAAEFYLGDRRGLAGIALEVVDGGVLERVTISNIAIEGTTSPIFLRLGDRSRKRNPPPGDDGLGTLRDVLIENVVATGASGIGCAMVGLPERPIEGIVLRNIAITFAGGGTADDARRDVPERRERYPECTMFGTLPAYALYCRHVKDLTLENVRVGCAGPDQRPALVCDDVAKLCIDSFDARTVPAAEPVLRFAGVRSALLRGCIAPVGTHAFLEIGAGSRRISVFGNDLSAAERAFHLAPTVDESVLGRAANRLRADRP